MDPKSKEFLALQKTWYKKIEKDGFEDIETNKHGDLKQDNMRYVNNRYNQERYDAKLNYYRLAEKFLNSHKFVTEKERLIWELHSEGFSIRETVSILKKRRFKVYRDMVHTVVKRLVKEMLK